MNILICHKWLILGGTETVLLSYLKLLQQNHKVKLLLNYDTADEHHLLSQIPDSVDYQFVFPTAIIQQQNALTVIRKKSIWHKLKYEWFKLKLNRQYKQTFFSEIEKHHYDLIIDFSGCLDSIIRQPATSVLKQIPTIRWVHGQLNGNRTMTTKQIKKFRQIFSRHHKTVTICPQMLEIISHDLNLPESCFTTIANPIDIQAILSAAENRPTIAKLPEKYLLQVSRLAKGKGHEELLAIFTELKKRGCTHKLVLVGDGENKATLEQLIEQYQLKDDCILVGATNNPYPYFRNANLFLHTSEHEGFGVVLLESMAFGVPVIAMDCKTGPRDILGENSQYGRLIAMHDKESFVDAVLELLENPQLYQHYQQQSLKRVQDFSLDTIQHQLNQFIENIPS